MWYKIRNPSNVLFQLINFGGGLSILYFKSCFISMNWKDAEPISQWEPYNPRQEMNKVFQLKPCSQSIKDVLFKDVHF